MPAGRTIQCRQFRLPRRGDRPEDCEDAVAADPSAGRFAIADGATEHHSGLWAKLLVEEFVKSPVYQPGPWATWLPGIQRQWAAEVDGQPGKRAWYAETKAQEGAFATFLGVVLEERSWWGRQRKQWRALAVGDSCLFQVRQGKLLAAFPVAKSEEFGHTPWLVGSRLLPGRKGIGQNGEWAPDDRLWLMTDALAQWFLCENEAGRKPWEALDRFLSGAAAEKDFAAWIEGLRDGERLRNDDVTLLAVGL